MQITLQPGDIFCTRNPMWLGRAISTVEKWQSKDNNAEYSHAGIITNPTGATVEALWTIKKSTLSPYAKDKILLGRWDGMDQPSFLKGMLGINKHMGDAYPFWRLIFHLIPGAAKHISTGNFAVCSELTCKFLLSAGCAEIGDWKGWNPDDVADMIKKWKAFSIIYEGVLCDAQLIEVKNG